MGLRHSIALQVLLALLDPSTVIDIENFIHFYDFLKREKDE